MTDLNPSPHSGRPRERHLQAGRQLDASPQCGKGSANSRVDNGRLQGSRLHPTAGGLPSSSAKRSHFVHRLQRTADTVRKAQGPRKDFIRWT